MDNMIIFNFNNYICKYGGDKQFINNNFCCNIWTNKFAKNQEE